MILCKNLWKCVWKIQEVKSNTMEVNIKEYKKKIIGLYWKNRYVNMYI